MTRAERRRLERKMKKGNKTYNLTVDQLNQIKDKAVTEATGTAFTLMLAIPLIVLRDKYGYGQKRMDKFIDYVLDTFDSFDKGYVSLEDIEQVLYDEVGLKVRDKQKQRQ